MLPFSVALFSIFSFPMLLWFLPSQQPLSSSPFLSSPLPSLISCLSSLLLLFSSSFSPLCSPFVSFTPVFYEWSVDFVRNVKDVLLAVRKACQCLAVPRRKREGKGIKKLGGCRRGEEGKRKGEKRRRLSEGEETKEKATHRYKLSHSLDV